MYKKIFSQTGILFLGNILRAVIQALYFFLLAREIGAYDFGVFTLILAVIAIISPWEGGGLGSIYLMKRSRGIWNDRDAQEIILWYLIIGVFLSIFSAMIQSLFILDIQSIFLLLFCISELIFFSLSSLFNLHFQSIGKFYYISIVNVIYGFFRLSGLAIFLSFSTDLSIEMWSIVYLISSFLAFLISLILFFSTVVRTKIRMDLALNKYKELTVAFHFSFSRFTASINGEADKLLISKFVSVEASGIYGLAMRVINMINMPLLSFFSVTYPEFFRIGGISLLGAVNLGVKLIIPIFFYMLIALVSFNLLGSLIIDFLGSDYIEVLDAISILIFYPLLRSLKTISADILSGSGFQKERAQIQLFILIFGLMILFTMIMYFGWQGACYSLLIIELLSFILFSIVIKLKILKESHENTDC